MTAMEHMMKKDFQKIQDVLIALLNTQRHLVHSRKVTAGYWELQEKFKPMEDQDEIKDLMDINRGKLRTNFLDSDKFLYFPPIPKNEKTIIIFSMDYNFRASMNKISFYIIVFQYPHNVKENPSYLGFRFESPEGMKGKKSRHDYWHVQIVKEFKGRHASKFPPIHKWLPVDMPCIPIKAHNPVSLLICLLFSFYGNQFFNAIDISFEEEDKRSLEGILCIEREKGKK